LAVFHLQPPARLSQLLKGPTDALAAYIPDFSYVLDHPGQFSDDPIKGTVMATVTMLLFNVVNMKGRRAYSTKRKTR
jgi:hypothetical protein